VQPAARVADALDELALDETVHVLVGTVHERRIPPPFLEDRVQATQDRRHVVRCQHARPPERLGPGQAARHVVLEQGSIEAERDAEVEGGGIGRTVETAGPESHESLPHRRGCASGEPTHRSAGSGVRA
jgi:hypothetical protein